MEDGSTTDDVFTLSVHECSIKGGVRLTVNTTCPLPEDELYIFLKGGQQSHRVATERISSTCIYSTLPAHQCTETVGLSVCLSKDDTSLFTTQFAYVTDHNKLMAELLHQSASEYGLSLSNSVLPHLPTPEAVREYDQTLAQTMRNIKLPPKWSLVGNNKHNTTTQKETLLHFSVRHGLNTLSQHLLSLPGSEQAVLLQNTQGQLPIDIAKERRNEGLVQLLTMYMNQIHSNGVLGDSPLSSPVHLRVDNNQELTKFKEINSQWTSEVKRYKALSHGSLTCLPNLDYPTPVTTSEPSTNAPSTSTHIHHIPLKKRRSSIAVMDSGHVQFHPPTPIDTVIINTRDSSLAVMERQRKTSWSRVVGSCDYRSMGTGLNELERISAEDTLHAKLVEVKTELAELDHSKQYPTHSKHHLGLSDTQLGLMYRLSSSCPTLNDDDDEDDSDAPNAFLSAATSPGRTNSPFSEDDNRIPSPQSSLNTLEGSTKIAIGNIPHVVTTEYSDTPQDRTVTRQTYSESELLAFESSSSLVTKKDVRANSLSILNETTPHNEAQSNVEESLVEHRQLRQMASTSPVSSEQTDDYVLVSSNISLDEIESSTSVVSDNMTPVGTPNDSKDSPGRVPTPVRSSVRFKSHRRSLSSSEVEMMSSVVTFAVDHAPETTPPSSQDWSSPLNGISSIDECLPGGSDTLSMDDLDKRSRASSLQTNDTCSMHESDTSEDDGDYLSAKESISTTSFDQQVSVESNTFLSPGSALLSEESDLVGDNTIVMRDKCRRQRIKASHTNRYSADFIISNIDDYQNDDEHVTANSRLVPKRRTNSSNIHDNLSEDNLTPKSSTSKQFLLEPRADDNVFPHDLSPSDIEVSVMSGENSLENSQSSVFYKATGSPKTIKKRKGKSPLLSRRSTIAHTKCDEAPSRRGLTKEEVGPTISTLKNLMKPLSNENDDGTFSFSNLERSGSNASDSSLTRSERAPIETPPPPEGEEEECSSLDFVPGSPLLVNKQKVAAPSPLAIRQAKSPPANIIGRAERSSSSPSPVPRSVVFNDIEESSTVKQTPSHGPNGSTEQELKFTNPAMPECPMLKSQEECVLPKEEDLKDKEREKTSRLKQFGEIFRSKSSKKPSGKDHFKSNDAEQLIESTHPVVKSNRPKSARKHRYEDVELKYVSPVEYEQVQQPTELTSSNIQRSASLQVGVNHVGTSSDPPNTHHSRSTSVQINEQLHKYPRLRKQQSEDFLVSPTRKSETVCLSPLEEVPSGSYDISSPSPHLLPTSPQVAPPSGESENEEQIHEEYQLVRSLSMSHPVLEIHDEPSWDKTVDRRLYKKLNKAERERQAILHELLQTEKNHFRALHVLKLIFRQHMTKITSEEMLVQLFPELDNLIEISDGFVKKLESKKRPNDDIIIEDLSDVLLEQFTGESRERILRSFGIFCSGHLNATEIYKEHMKKKSFSRLIKQLNSLKECQRLTLPDYYLAVSQRLAKLLTLLKRLAKKSDSLKLAHAPRVRESLENLETLIAAVDQTVEDNKNRMEVEAIQSRLEVSIPRSSKIKNRQEIKRLSLTAQDRKLRKRGLALWIGHGREVSVHLILVTDLVVLLTERDQKYHLASLQDLKPPVIRLYDLHVRLNVSVKTGVQLLLLEKGNSPEMFRLEFVSKKLAKEWEAALSVAIDQCKEKGLKCEYFGAEKVVSGDEEKKSEEKEDSDLEEEAAALSLTCPALKSMQRARESLALATKLLTTSTLSSTTTTDSPRYHGVAIATTGGSGPPPPFLQETYSPKNRNRSQTTQRPKTSFFPEDDGTGSSATISGDHVISAPIPPPIKSSKSSKSEKKKGKLDRSSTFRGKDKEREKYVSRDHVAESDNHFRVPEQQYIRCITSLKDSLQEIMNQNEDKENELVKLRNELESLRESLHSQKSTPSPAIPHRLSPRSSPSQMRPHSMHVDLSDLDKESLSMVGREAAGNETMHSQSELLVTPTESSKVKNGTPNGSMLKFEATISED